MRATPGRLRWLFVCGGVTCVAFGAVGAFVPGVPTMEFVLGGSYLLARGSPALDARLRRSALFSPLVKYLDPTVPLPRRVRALALASMWTSVGLSATILQLSGAGGTTAMAPLAAGVVATWMIVTFRNGLHE